MRKVQKQEVLDVIQSLHQAHEEIKDALNQRNSILAQNMLAECQEFAAALGESIEQMEGKGHATVSYIETYCEVLYHIHAAFFFSDNLKKFTNELIYIPYFMSGKIKPDKDENRVHEILLRCDGCI